MPVRGTKATIEAIFKNAWPPIQAVIPIARVLEKVSGAFLAILSALTIKYINREIITSPPISPSSSAITAKIESVEASGRKEYF